MSHNREAVPPVPDLNITILQAIQGMMELMMEDRQERRAQQQRQERILQEDEGIVVQERQVEGRWRERNNHATIMQPRRMNRVHEDRDWGVKLKIPPFCGTADSEAYFKWERKIEHVFDCNIYSENKKMRLAIAEFTNHAGDWYQHLKSE